MKNNQDEPEPLPLINFVQEVGVDRTQHTQQMDEESFPNSKFKFMHKVNDQ